MKTCVACAEEIRIQAKLCKHCGTLQDDPKFLEASGRVADLKKGIGLNASELERGEHQRGRTITKTCKSCHVENFANSPFCSVCGNTEFLSKMPDASDSKVAESHEMAGNYLPQLGVTNANHQDGELSNSSASDPKGDAHVSGLNVPKKWAWAVFGLILLLLVSAFLSNRGSSNLPAPEEGDVYSNPFVLSDKRCGEGGFPSVTVTNTGSDYEYFSLWVDVYDEEGAHIGQAYFGDGLKAGGHVGVGKNLSTPWQQSNFDWISSQVSCEFRLE